MISIEFSFLYIYIMSGTNQYIRTLSLAIIVYMYKRGFFYLYFHRFQ